MFATPSSRTRIPKSKRAARLSFGLAATWFRLLMMLAGIAVAVSGCNMSKMM
jgi:hypothetical protein